MPESCTSIARWTRTSYCKGGLPGTTVILERVTSSLESTRIMGASNQQQILRCPALTLRRASRILLVLGYGAIAEPRSPRISQNRFLSSGSIKPPPSPQPMSLYQLGANHTYYTAPCSAVTSIGSMGITFEVLKCYCQVHRFQIIPRQGPITFHSFCRVQYTSIRFDGGVLVSSSLP